MKKTFLATGRGWRVMKTCVRCLLLVPMLLTGSFFAEAQAQQPVSRITLDARNESILHVFQTIQQQTGYSFVYNTADIDTGRAVNLSSKGDSLTAVLDKLFGGTDIAYTLRDKHIVLSKKAPNSPPPRRSEGRFGNR